MRIEDLTRERACFEAFAALPEVEAIVIGGYAISAHGPPRFSVDLDLVIQRSSLQPIRVVLQQQGFSQERRWIGGVYGGDFERWVREPGPSKPSIDLMVDEVVDRRSGARFSYDMIRRYSSRRTVRGIDEKSKVEALVPDPEVLIGLKWAPGRKADQRDITILSDMPIDKEKLGVVLASCPRDAILKTARQILVAVETKEFRDSLKGTYVLNDRTYERYARNVRGLCLWAEKKFASQDN